MADGDVEVGTKLDTSGLDKGIKDMKAKLDGAGKSVEKSSGNIGKLNTVLGEASGSAGGFANKIGSAAAAGGQYVAAAVAAIAVTKKTVDALNECAKAYRVQANAEQALQNAAQNNPYLDGESVIQLEAFAGELQKTTEIGDETSIQLMAQLASAGRTQEEIEKIMSAAADYAAGTNTDIASAVQTLNATFSGMSGTLGRQIDGVKDLTEEELKNGAAIDLIAKKYKGMAASTADVEEQLGNAWGDFKENIGSGWQKVTQPVKQFFLDVLSNINEATAKTKNLNGAKTADANGTATSTQEQLVLDQKEQQLANLEKHMQDLDKWYQDAAKRSANTKNYAYGQFSQDYKNDIQNMKDWGSELERLVPEWQALKDEVASYQQKVRDTAEAEEKAKKAAEDAATAAEKKAKIDERNKTAAQYIDDNTAALNQNIAAIKLKAEAEGKEADAGEIYSAYLNSYVDLVAKSNGLVTENNTVAKKRKEQLDAAAVAAKNASDAEDKLNKAIDLTNEAINEIGDIQVVKTPTEELNRKLEEIKKIRDGLAGMTDKQIADAQTGSDSPKTREELNSGLDTVEANAKQQAIQSEQEKTDAIAKIDKDAFAEYADEQQALVDRKAEIDASEVLSEEEKERQKAEIDKKAAQNKAKLWADTFAEINQYTQQATQTAQDAGALMLENVQNESELETAALEEKYTKGEISEEEYTEKKAEIDKKAAKEEYKIKMFEWTAQMLSATANIAEGVSKAIAQGGVAGIITGALVSAAGAVQLASIIASKPVAPSFSTGGIVGGTSYSGDNIQANVNSGEAIFTLAQQRQLWEMANGRGSGNGDVIVNNTESNHVSTQVKQTNEGLVIDILDKHINKSISDGTYDGGFAEMNNRQNGTVIL
jgi:hypothetical protein